MNTGIDVNKVHNLILELKMDDFLRGLHLTKIKHTAFNDNFNQNGAAMYLSNQSQELLEI